MFRMLFMIIFFQAIARIIKVLDTDGTTSITFLEFCDGVQRIIDIQGKWVRLSQCKTIQSNIRLDWNVVSNYSKLECIIRSIISKTIARCIDCFNLQSIWRSL